MNKKILTLIFLLILLFSIIIAYDYIKQISTKEKEFNRNTETIDDKSLSEEVDNTFVEEYDEVEIGEML